ncbi:DUF429 domain-containing protein [Rhodoferax aquaticus]|uniref:DUF429 domain-containing protein n=1 Tax=Rhodoferax aquaticus TaxID=2527691 RepID=A0A515EM81_9BURK|nr:DUF429 domain-containing protein [Rhodoferax aquaticus]QDL53751.1 DUF429 domain-containing protein [Rhodoferax aquaticus]
MVTLLGCDFSSSPSARKQIVLAYGQLDKSRVQLLKIERFSSLAAWSAALQAQTHWVGGFDLPFGLPRELVEALGWPRTWRECMQWYARLSREQIRTEFKAFCDARPAGSKFAHRATDGLAGSSSSMKWVNPPVAYMMHAGVPALLALGASFPGLHSGTTLKPARVALEAYPGMLAREVLGRTSYKSDDKSKHTTERLIARKDLINALELGLTRLNLRLRLSHAQRDALVADASGDALDAVLCLVQAAWAQTQYANGHPNYGLPSTMDTLEGWIVSA